MKIALIYDFDGTLSPGNMQEYNFIPDVGKNAEEFWSRSDEVAKRHDADPILTYLYEIISGAQRCEISLRRESFQSYGRGVQLFRGVEQWFERMNHFARERGVQLEHYINSSGIKEMIEGTSIAHHFKRIYACSFLYNVDGVAYWPSVAVNYTNKTQFLFKINKGISEVCEDKLINEYIPEQERPMPFRRMIYLGDGTTDIPCMRLVKEKRGHSIAVYDPHKKAQLEAKMNRLLDDDRVNFVAPADYGEGERLDRIVKQIIEKIVADNILENL
ncbi:MAG: HAD family hydrolase [Rikenellaceae bacterium]